MPWEPQYPLPLLPALLSRLFLSSDARWWLFLDFILCFFAWASELMLESSGSLSDMLWPCLWTLGWDLFFFLLEWVWRGRGSIIVPVLMLAFCFKFIFLNSAFVSTLQYILSDSYFCKRDSKVAADNIPPVMHSVHHYRVIIYESPWDDIRQK